MYNLVEYTDIYSKKSGSFWQYYRDEHASDSTNNIIDLLTNNDNSILFKFKGKIM